MDMLCSTGKVTDREAALEAVMEREKKMSTDMEHGIAFTLRREVARLTLNTSSQNEAVMRLIVLEEIVELKEFFLYHL